MAKTLMWAWLYPNGQLRVLNGASRAFARAKRSWDRIQVVRVEVRIVPQKKK